MKKTIEERGDELRAELAWLESRRIEINFLINLKKDSLAMIERIEAKKEKNK